MLTCIFKRLFVYRLVYLTDFLYTDLFKRLFVYRPGYLTDFLNTDLDI